MPYQALRAQRAYYWTTILVTGIQLARRTKLTFIPPEYDRWAITSVPPGKHTVLVSLSIALKLEEFIQVCFVQRKQGFNCFSFVDFVMGFTNNPRARSLSYHTKRVGPADILFGKPYLIGDHKNIPFHAVLGWLPGLTLGVNGDDSELAVCPIMPLVRAYGGTSILRITEVYTECGVHL